ncbi:MAG: YciI family protein [Cyclobacteriaceae bacterium]
MEKFMLIFHGGQYNGLSAEKMQVKMGQWYAWIEKLNKTKQYLSGEPLMPGGKDVKGPNGKTVTDGPYTEGNEVVGGYFIINAKDYDEAVTISKDYPDYEMGGYVQVRQVMKMEG